MEPNPPRSFLCCDIHLTIGRPSVILSSDMSRVAIKAYAVVSMSADTGLYHQVMDSGCSTVESAFQERIEPTAENNTDIISRRYPETGRCPKKELQS